MAGLLRARCRLGIMSDACSLLKRAVIAPAVSAMSSQRLWSAGQHSGQSARPFSYSAATGGVTRSILGLSRPFVLPYIMALQARIRSPVQSQQVVCKRSLVKVKIEQAKKYKLKSHSGSKKRFRFTSTGKIKRWRTGHRHHSYRKGRKRMLKLKKAAYVHRVDMKRVRRSLPYGHFYL